MRHLLSYLALRIGVRLLGLLPVRAAQRLGSWGGLVFHRVASGRRDMARRHMARVLGEGGDPRTAARRMFYWYGRYWGEALWVRGSRIEELRSRLTCDGLEYIEKAKADGRGMIFALPHMGNWEIAAPLAVERDIPLVAVAEQLRNPRITSWFTAMRAEFGIEIVLATGTGEVMRRLNAALADNKAVALLADRDLRRRGRSVEFFGEETSLPQGPASLAVMTGAPLMPVGCYFDGAGHHAVVLPPLPIPAAGSRSQQIKELTQALAHHMEDLVRRAPEQWHLLQPNWPSDLG